jgi:hypothetical protein
MSKTKEILERLSSKTMHENTPEGFIWAQQLAKDLRIAVKALTEIKNNDVNIRPDLHALWALREIDL